MSTTNVQAQSPDGQPPSTTSTLKQLTNALKETRATWSAIVAALGVLFQFFGPLEPADSGRAKIARALAKLLGATVWLMFLYLSFATRRHRVLFRLALAAGIAALALTTIYIRAKVTHSEFPPLLTFPGPVVEILLFTSMTTLWIICWIAVTAAILRQDEGDAQPPLTDAPMELPSVSPDGSPLFLFYLVAHGDWIKINEDLSSDRSFGYGPACHHIATVLAEPRRRTVPENIYASQLSSSDKQRILQRALLDLRLLRLRLPLDWLFLGEFGVKATLLHTMTAIVTNLLPIASLERKRDEYTDELPLLFPIGLLGMWLFKSLQVGIHLQCRRLLDFAETIAEMQPNIPPEYRPIYSGLESYLFESVDNALTGRIPALRRPRLAAKHSYEAMLDGNWGSVAAEFQRQANQLRKDVVGLAPISKESLIADAALVGMFGAMRAFSWIARDHNGYAVSTDALIELADKYDQNSAINELLKEFEPCTMRGVPITPQQLDDLSRLEFRSRDFRQRFGRKESTTSQMSEPSTPSSNSPQHDSTSDGDVTI
jgi:hypothetical protein